MGMYSDILEDSAERFGQAVQAAGRPGKPDPVGTLSRGYVQQLRQMSDSELAREIRKFGGSERGEAYRRAARPE